MSKKKLIYFFFFFQWGFFSGLPLLLTSVTLGTWLADVGVNKTTIGLFALVGIPYSLKFLWASFLDTNIKLMLLKKDGKKKNMDFDISNFNLHKYIYYGSY